MKTSDIATQRLGNQRLVGPPLDAPADVVRWLCAVQAQDYAGAKWALAQRCAGTDDAAIDRCFDDGAILRTHVLRPTWHFVAPEDIRWLLALTGPRVLALNGPYERKLGLDAKVLARSQKLIARALEGGHHLTRDELAAELQRGGIEASGMRLAYLVMRAELEALICSGPRRGKQFTYALLDERVPAAPTPTRDEALAALTRRFLASHGPATARDLAWWSGLTIADVKAGLASIAREVEQVTCDEITYWRLDSAPTTTKPQTPVVHLLPNYDEHLIAFKDRAAAFRPGTSATLVADPQLLAAHFVVVNGFIVGGWRRTLEKKSVVVRPRVPLALTAREKRGIEAEVERYERFLGVPVTRVDD